MYIGNEQQFVEDKENVARSTVAASINIRRSILDDPLRFRKCCRVRYMPESDY